MEVTTSRYSRNLAALQDYHLQSTPGCLARNGGIGYRDEYRDDIRTTARHPFAKLPSSHLGVTGRAHVLFLC